MYSHSENLGSNDIFYFIRATYGLSHKHAEENKDIIIILNGPKDERNTYTKDIAIQVARLIVCVLIDKIDLFFRQIRTFTLIINSLSDRIIFLYYSNL